MCESNPCHNDGTCLQEEESLQYNCTCVTGYEGDQCDIGNRSWKKFQFHFG